MIRYSSEWIAILGHVSIIVLNHEQKKWKNTIGLLTDAKYNSDKYLFFLFFVGVQLVWRVRFPMLCLVLSKNFIQIISPPKVHKETAHMSLSFVPDHLRYCLEILSIFADTCLYHSSEQLQCQAFHMKRNAVTLKRYAYIWGYSERVQSEFRLINYTQHLAQPAVVLHSSTWHWSLGLPTENKSEI